jgi:hypothetical protein
VGEPIRVIGSVGRGPGEYTYPTGFHVFPESGDIVVFDKDSWKVIYYSKTGEFQKEFRISFPTHSFGVIDNDRIAFYKNRRVFENDLNYDLVVTNARGEVLMKEFPYNSESFGVGYSPLPSAFYYLNGLKFISPYSNTVYSVSDHVTIGLKLDFGDFNLPIKMTNDEFREYHYDYCVTEQYLENKKYQFVSVFQNYRRFHLIIDKESKNLKMGILVNDINYIPFQPKAITDHLVAGELSPVFLNKLRNMGEQELSDRSRITVDMKVMHHSIPEVDLDDNPVIVLAHVKE